MAIPFLNNLDISNNQLLNAKLQITGTAPNAAAGQIYFDSTVGDETAKYYSNVTDTWVSLKEYTFPAGSFITGAVTGTTPKPIITFDLSAVDGTGAGVGERYLSKNNKWETIASIPGTYTWSIQGDAGGPTAVASGDAIDFAGGTNVTTDFSGTTLTINSTDQFVGTLTGIGAGTYISVDNSTPAVPIVNALGTEAATASRLVARDADGYGYVVTPASGDSTTKIATTAFVQSSLTGLLEFKGGFNASTGAIVGGGNLTFGGTRVAVEVGDYYVVTVAGDFFGNAATPLTPGDSVIVQTAAVAGASVEADFIVVQSDTDLATLTTVGLGNVNASTLDAELGIEVAYAAGTAKVGLDIEGLALDLLVEQPADYFLPIYDGGSGINNKAKLSELLAFGNQSTSKTGTITAGSLSGTVTHTFGINTLVQTINSSGDTVYCDVTRTATTSVATIAVAEATDITILVQKIG